MIHLKDLREAIFEEIKARTLETDLSVPSRTGSYWYYRRTQEGQQYPIVCRAAADEDDWTPPQLEPGVDVPGEDRASSARKRPCPPAAFRRTTSTNCCSRSSTRPPSARPSRRSMLAKGINAGPGAATGRIKFFADDAEAHVVKHGNRRTASDPKAASSSSAAKPAPRTSAACRRPTAS